MIPAPSGSRQPESGPAPASGTILGSRGGTPVTVTRTRDMVARAARSLRRLGFKLPVIIIKLSYRERHGDCERARARARNRDRAGTGTIIISAFMTVLSRLRPATAALSWPGQ